MSSSTKSTIARTGCAFRSTVCWVPSSAPPSPSGQSRAHAKPANKLVLKEENAMDVNMLLESVRESLHQVGAFLPRLLLAILILVLGWLVAKAVRFAIVKGLRAINFNVVTDKAGVDQFLKKGGANIDTVRVLGSLAYWLVILAALM